jgi:hypothetical protein
LLDDAAMARRGEWTSSASIAGFVGERYWHDGNEEKGAKEARFTGKIAKAGTYEVRLAYSPNPNRATNVPIEIAAGGTTTHVTVNQRQRPTIETAFVTLGTVRLDADQEVSVTISNKGTDGFVIVDAVWLVAKP